MIEQNPEEKVRSSGQDPTVSVVNRDIVHRVGYCDTDHKYRNALVSCRAMLSDCQNDALLNEEQSPCTAVLESPTVDGE